MSSDFSIRKVTRCKAIGRSSRAAMVACSLSPFLIMEPVGYGKIPSQFPVTGQTVALESEVFADNVNPPTQLIIECRTRERCRLCADASGLAIVTGW